jgi:hypothetical protein
MLQRVPASTEAIRRIGSTEPAAMLYDAMEVGIYNMCTYETFTYDTATQSYHDW